MLFYQSIHTAPLTQWIKQAFPVLALVRGDLATSTSDVRSSVECLPEVVQGFLGWTSTDVKQNADFWLQTPSKGIEELKPRMEGTSAQPRPPHWTHSETHPSMTIDFLLVLLLQAKQDLNRYDPFIPLLRILEFH